MKVELKLITENGIYSEVSTLMNDGRCKDYITCKIWDVVPILEKVKPLEYKITYFPFWATFFDYLGTQNYYPPVEKPHWWKTRIGFDTAWRLAKTINS